MDIKVTPSFSGRLDVKTPELQSFVTKRVKDAIKAAPKGTKLVIQQGDKPYTIKIGFTTPASKENPIAGYYGSKAELNEQSILAIIKRGREKMRKGITENWMMAMFKVG